MSHRHAATDQEIQKWVVRHHGFVPQGDWIAHCKELCGIAVAAAERSAAQECPADRRPAIQQAFRYFGLLRDTP